MTTPTPKENERENPIAMKHKVHNPEGSYYGTPKISSILASFESEILYLNRERRRYTINSKAFARHQDEARLEAATRIMELQAQDRTEAEYSQKVHENVTIVAKAKGPAEWTEPVSGVKLYNAAAQEQAVTEAKESVAFALVSTKTEGIIDDGDVFIKQAPLNQTIINIVGYEKFKAMQESVAAPQNRGEG